VKNVYLLGRRGPAQAAFTPQEIVEVGELLDADVTVSPEEASPDAASLLSIQANPDKNVDKNVAAIADYSTRGQTGKSRLLTFRFLVSPTEITGRDGRVEAIKLVKNEGYQADDGSVRARATGVEEEIKVGLVFRSVGYRGIALPDVPFNDSWGTIRNEKGRVQSEGGDNLPGVYTAGWIKRGPSGVIGTNKTCANETVNCMVEDLAAGSHFNPTETAPASVESLIRGRQPKAVTYEDWKKIDQAELANGEDAGRPRLKFTNIDDMLAALGR
jgi:ferredoxin--NADP+ reductase